MRGPKTYLRIYHQPKMLPQKIKHQTLTGSNDMGIITDKKKTASSSSTSPCANLRAAYHNCFNKWYSEKFLKGQWEKEDCVVEWKKYRACLSECLEDKKLSRFLEAEGPVDFTSPVK